MVAQAAGVNRALHEASVLALARVTTRAYGSPRAGYLRRVDVRAARLHAANTPPALGYPASRIRLANYCLFS